jgi:hypothetical protein
MIESAVVMIGAEVELPPGSSYTPTALSTTMFKFNFEDEQDGSGDSHHTPASPSDVEDTCESCVEIPLVELVRLL